jgi:hypothetical protein
MPLIPGIITSEMSACGGDPFLEKQIVESYTSWYDQIACKQLPAKVQ